MRRKSFYIAAFFLHFSLIVAIAARELLWIIPRSSTILPSAAKPYAESAEQLIATGLAQSLNSSDPIRRGVTTYLHLAGIEAGYGFFAPNVSDTCKLVFELHYPDGHVEETVPVVNSEAAGLRIATLLDQIARPQNEALREVMVKMLAHSVWREHPDTTLVRAIVGTVQLPTVNQFEHGSRESSKFLYAYDFAFGK